MPHQFVDSISSCYDFYFKDKEDKVGWDVLSKKNSSKWSKIACPENWKYRNDDELAKSSHKRQGVHALYGSGGYIADLGYDGKTAGRILKDLVANRWIDRQTRVVLVEISMLNAATKLLADVTLYFEMLPSGYLQTSLAIQVIPLVDKISVDAYMFIFLVFTFVLGFYLVSECVRAYQLKCFYFTSMWNWLEMLQVISAILVIAFSIKRDIKTSKLLLQLKKNPFASVSFDDTFFWFDLEESMIYIAVSVAVLRILRLLKINNHVVVLLLVIKKSLKPVMSFSVVFFVIFIAYGHAGVLLFGKNVYMFSSFKRVVMSLFQMSLGRSPPRSELELVNVIFAKLYTQSFAFLTVIILVNMFVAILNEAQTESTSSAKDSTDTEVANLLMSLFFHFLGMERQHFTVNQEEEIAKESPEKDVMTLDTDTSEKDTKQLEISANIETERTNNCTLKRASLSNNTSQPLHPPGSFLAQNGYGMPSLLDKSRFSRNSISGQNESLELSSPVSAERYISPPIQIHSCDGQSEPTQCFGRSLFPDKYAMPSASQNSSHGKSKASESCDQQIESSGLSPVCSTLSLESWKSWCDQRQSSEFLDNSFSPDTDAMPSVSRNSYYTHWENVLPASLAPQKSAMSLSLRCSLDGHSELGRFNSPVPQDSRAGQSQIFVATPIIPSSQSISSTELLKKDSESIINEEKLFNLVSDTDCAVKFASDVNARLFSVSAMESGIAPVDHAHLQTTPGKKRKSCDKPTNDKASTGCKSEGIIAATQTDTSSYPTSTQQRTKIIDFDEVSEWMTRAKYYENRNDAPLGSQTKGSHSTKKGSESTNLASASRKVIIDFDEVSEWIKMVNTYGISFFRHSDVVITTTRRNMNTRKRRDARKEKASEKKAAQLENRARMLDTHLPALDFWE